MLRNRIPSCCLFRGMIRNTVPSVCLYFCSTEQNSELFSFPRNGSEWNSERLLLILFHGTKFWAFFYSAERFGMEFREFSVPRNSRNSAGTYQLFCLFRLPRNNFLLEIAILGCRQIHHENKWERVGFWKLSLFWALWNDIKPLGESYIFGV